MRTLDSDNLPALGNLIQFHFAILDDGPAERYGKRLRAFVISDAYAPSELNKVVEALGLLEDDETLLRVANKTSDFDAGELNGETWYTLSAAAANAGNAKLAKRLLENAQARGSSVEHWVDIALGIVKNGRSPRYALKGFSLQERFPYIHYTRFLTQTIVENFLHIDDYDDTFEVIRKTARHYPYIAGAFRLILWHETDPSTRAMAMDGFAALQTDAVMAELHLFASSQVGSVQHRMEALQMLQKAGRLDEGELFRLWDETDGEWHEVTIFEQEISEWEESPCTEAAQALMEQAELFLHEGPEESEEHLRQAIEILEQAMVADPGCAVAVHNQGVLYSQLGEVAKGEALIRRALVIDPDYLYAYCTLAKAAHNRGDLEEAMALLEKVLSAPRIEAGAFLWAQEIQFWIAIDERELDAASRILDLMESFMPDNPKLENLRKLLSVKEIVDGMFGDIYNYHQGYRQKQVKKPITATADLATCLNRISRERLAATLRAWNLPSKGRKAEVIARLMTCILDPEHLAPFMDANLTGQELLALIEIQEQGGITPYHGFLERYGDESGESPFWQHNQPHSVAGRLQMFGLLMVGMLDGEAVLLIPADLRPALQKLA